MLTFRCSFYSLCVCVSVCVCTETCRNLIDKEKCLLGDLIRFDFHEFLLFKKEKFFKKRPDISNCHKHMHVLGKLAFSCSLNGLETFGSFQVVMFSSGEFICTSFATHPFDLNRRLKIITMSSISCTTVGFFQVFFFCCAGTPMPRRK